VPSKLIGKVFATEKCPTSVDKFTFWTDQNLILNPFDLVKVEHVNGSHSYGMIEDIHVGKQQLHCRTFAPMGCPPTTFSLHNQMSWK
jgi:hypothetical protein